MKCYELKQVVCQNDLEFINILNRFQISSHTFEDIDFINKICLKAPLIDNVLPHLFYTNAKTIDEHNKIIFQNTLGQTFTFHAKDIHFETCQSHFKLPMIPSQIVGLHYELLILKVILMKLCVGNHITSYGLVDGLVNGADMILKIM
jgi:hypothetical protein